MRIIQTRLNEAEVRGSFPMLSFIAKSEERQSGLEFA
jgi:hypothetical protein